MLPQDQRRVGSRPEDGVPNLGITAWALALQRANYGCSNRGPAPSDARKPNSTALRFRLPRLRRARELRAPRRGRAPGRAWRHSPGRRWPRGPSRASGGSGRRRVGSRRPGGPGPRRPRRPGPRGRLPRPWCRCRSGRSCQRFPPERRACRSSTVRWSEARCQQINWSRKC